MTSLAISHIPIAQTLHNLCALFHGLGTLRMRRFSPGELWMWYNVLYLNTTIFKEKFMKYQGVFVKCRKSEGIIILKNFTFTWKREAVRHEQVLNREHLSFCHDIPLIAGRNVGRRTVWGKSNTVYQLRQK